MSVVVILAVTFVQTGLLVWPEALGCRILRSIEASLSRIDASLTVTGARFVAFDARRNGCSHVAVDHPRLIEMLE
jgi:hypothetical protein